MRTVRRIILWLVLAAIAALVVLSIVGAFFGADRARGLFNSAPLIVYWFLLAALLAAGFVFFKRLIRSPAALGMHLGSLLVLAGAMWGSEAGHDVARALWGSKKTPGGYMVIHEGQQENHILDETMTPVAELPFHIRLKDFWIAYYPSKQKTWRLVVVGPVREAAGRAVQERQVDVAWTVGTPTDVPLTHARLTVLQYLEHAAATFDAGAEPAIEINLPGDKTVTLPARVGAEVALDDPKMTVRVVQVFENMRLRGAGDDRKVVDLPGEGANPAVLLHLIEPGGAIYKRYLMALVPMHRYRDPGPPMAYVLPEAAGARADPSSPLPAMEVLVEHAGRRLRHWFLPGKGDPYVSMDLAPLLWGKDEPAHAEGAAHGQARTALFLVKPTGPIRDYFSELSVIEGGKQVAAKVIEVNHPLHWGGYHFYQADYDHQAGRYTVLSVSSDSGLPAVWIGFALLVAGTFWRFWGAPAVRYVAQRRTAGETDAN